MKKFSKICIGIAVCLVVAFMMATPASAQSYCLQDSYGYVWDLTVVDSNASGMYMTGSVVTGFDTREVVATYRSSGSGVTLQTDQGATGVAFHYNLAWKGSSGSGLWMNLPYGGYGLVDVWLCNFNLESAPKTETGPAPGIE